MAGIQIGGIASGMDTESIITQLMSIESAPRTRTARQQVTVQARQDALRQIDTKLTNLKLAAGDLRLGRGSPCIDAGRNSLALLFVATDLDGLPRFRDDPATADTGDGVPPIIDMGAYEFQPD